LQSKAFLNMTKTC